MPKSYQQTQQIVFNKGLLTEHSELAFPQEASVDEINCDLVQAGYRVKRTGVRIEAGDTPTAAGLATDKLISTNRWTAVRNDPDVEYLVLQVGGTLYFYLKGNLPTSGNLVAGSVDLVPYSVSGGLGAAASRVECASINGSLVVVSPQIEAVLITQEANDSFTVEQINFEVRDFETVGDSDAYELAESYTTITDDPLRLYDTLNSGWGTNDPSSPYTTALTTWTAANTSYPPLTHPWFSGKDSGDNFSVAEFGKIYSGSSFISQGHYILNPFYKDRSAVSGVADLPIESTTNRFTTVATYAGRVFFSGAGSTVYFSPVLLDNKDIGKLHQVNDPTSEYFSDLLATDGGSVTIQEASGIRKLHVVGPSLMVFASNGVWKLSGVDDVFKANEYSVNKVSEYGLAVRGSFSSSANGLPFWWSSFGIHTMIIDENGVYREQNISKATIQTFWNAIPTESKIEVFSCYDPLINKIFWMYPSDGETVSSKANDILVFDVNHGAFYPWSISDEDEDTSYVVGMYSYSGLGASIQTFDVVDEAGNQVQDASGNDVVANLQTGLLAAPTVTLVVVNADGSVSFGEFTEDVYYDWGDAGYEAYLVSAYNFKQDMSRRKHTPYITVLMKSGEDPSLSVSAAWDFKETFSTPQQAYRLVFPRYDGGPVSDRSILNTRLKLRGSGRSVRVKFEGEEGKSFSLVGWETLDEVKNGY